MTVVIITILFFGIWIGLVLPHYATKFVADREKQRELASLIPTGVDEFRLCPGPHEWLEIISVNEYSEYSPLNVCKNCGFLPSKNLMATPEGLKRILDNRKIRELEDSIQKDFVDKENSDIKKLLENEGPEGTLTDGIIGEIYRAGQTSNKRYIIYKIARAEELRREQKDEA
jgi:hypothetical protein